MDDTGFRSLEKNRDILTDVLKAMGLSTTIHPDTTAREGVLVLSGTLFMELVGSVAQAQNAAADRDDALRGAAAFVQGWESAFEAMNAVLGDGERLAEQTQVAALSAMVELVGKVIESYIDPDAVNPLLFAASQAMDAAGDLLVLTTRNPADLDTGHTYTHTAYEGLANAHRAMFYTATHPGAPYVEEH